MACRQDNFIFGPKLNKQFHRAVFYSSLSAVLCPYFASFVALRDESLKQNLWLKQKSMIEIRNSCFLDERRRRRQREEAEEEKNE